MRRRARKGALVTLDRDGAVRAMVGGRDYRTSNYNRATQAKRQPGSSFKLFVYLAALEAGYNPNSMVQDAPITIGRWSPRNSNGRYMGPIPMRVALAYSVNTVAVRLAQEVGTRTVADMAQRFGITTRVSTSPAMALGASEARLIDMTRAYAAVARGGIGVTPYGIRRVTTADGTLALPASGRSEPGAGPALGGAADDRIARRRGLERHRARRRSRPADRGQDRHDHRRTRTAGSSAFRAASPPASGWAATTIALCPAYPAGRRRRAPSTI